MSMAQGGSSSSRDLIRSVSGHSNNLMSEVAKVIIGKPENIRKVTIGILANGNILIEDNPGLAKTLMSNTFAQALGCKFKRVQFTPDLLPADIIGTYMYDQKTGEFRRGSDPYSRTSCSLTRSTEPLPRPRRHFWRRWRRSR